jgi:hypothetical protein
MLKLRSTQICLRDPQVYTIRQTYRREMDEGLLLGRAPRSVQSLVPQLPVAWDLEPDSRLAMVYSEPRLWSVCARAPPCIRPCHSPRLRRCRPAGTWVAGNMLGEIARVIASNYTPGKGRRSGPRRKPSCLMSSGYQPTLWKGAILRAPLI